MKNLILLYSFFISGFVCAQKTNHIEFIAYPFFQRFGDLTKQYTSVTHENFEVDCIKTPSVEFGLQYHHKFKGKWGYGIGTSWQYSTYRTYFLMRHPQFPTSKFQPTYRKTEVQSFSWRFSTSYQIIDRIRLNAHVSAYFPYNEKSNSESWYENTTFSNGIFYYAVKIIEGGYVGNPDIIPEISMNFEIVPNFNLLLGFRCKFWSLENDNHYQIEVVGSTEPETYGQQDLIFQYKENSKVIGYYFGLSYNLPLRLKKKTE